MIGLAAIRERPTCPPTCKTCGSPEIYRLGVCEYCYDKQVEDLIDEAKERGSYVFKPCPNVD